MTNESVLAAFQQYPHRLIGSIFGQTRRFFRFTYILPVKTLVPATVADRSTAEILGVVRNNPQLSISETPAVLTVGCPIRRIGRKFSRRGSGRSSRTKRQKYTSSVLGIEEVF